MEMDEPEDIETDEFEDEEAVEIEDILSPFSFYELHFEFRCEGQTARPVRELFRVLKLNKGQKPDLRYVTNHSPIVHISLGGVRADTWVLPQEKIQESILEIAGWLLSQSKETLKKCRHPDLKLTLIIIAAKSHHLVDSPKNIDHDDTRKLGLPAELVRACGQMNIGINFCTYIYVG